MASTSNNHIDDDQDIVIRSPPWEHNTVLSPVQGNDDQIPVNNTDDPKDGE
ncbi:hypothetical protein A2U01_0069339 [Trifolium medium]|uniref:Uncharacterized protein n=1 Tax=Trifolium medium TaxID=97028 RepID=A0A392SJQ0_9FABA|nr:hypothetical protein [Trifolium medium]